MNPVTVERHPYQNLLVKVIGAKNIRSRDIGSESDCYVQAHIPTASSQPQCTVTVNNSSNPVWNHTFKYHIYTGIKNNEELEVEFELHECTDTPGEILTNGVLAKETTLKSSELMDVRLRTCLCQEETRFLELRRPLVARALKKALGLKADLDPKQVPVVAVLGSGGGTRAMTSLYGSLLGLQDLGMLDCVTYLSGVSGSTWCMSALYENADWSCESLSGPIAKALISTSGEKMSAYSLSRLSYYTEELRRMQAEEQNVSLTDFWGLVVEFFLYRQEKPARLSDQKKAVACGQNPLPIYAGINVKTDLNAKEFAEWCEFTPYEAGFSKYGAFVRTEDFRSQFNKGHLIKRMAEPRISYLLGMWGSAFAASLDEIWKEVTGKKPEWLNNKEDGVELADDIKKSSKTPSSDGLLTQVVTPSSPISYLFDKLLNSRFSSCQSHNFLHGLNLHSKYHTSHEFMTDTDSHPDTFPSKLTPSEPVLNLVDSGLSINSAFPLVLHAAREVDLILSFDYSWGGHFDVLKLTQQYCSERSIPFPPITLSEEDLKNPKECYIFTDTENPKIPIVLHFPLINQSFRKFKAPGVPRVTPEEKDWGDFVVECSDSPYCTSNFTYSKQQYSRLVELNQYNVLNNKDTLLQALQLALDKRAKKP
ncbi:cytosolic phospholipase A2 zeta-like isoform X2 [Polyodon spathula]|uniref:cytosolic phospholipase A2 zeta-like isoform X2 n=1 Tax=Polyodon spathula TaxID=7913 RepID=UPI001B7E559D|nr:cytosolic phospholipase A2 zeta-like isoform X2 [Polyodon spathula]